MISIEKNNQTNSHLFKQTSDQNEINFFYIEKFFFTDLKYHK